MKRLMTFVAGLALSTLAAADTYTLDFICVQDKEDFGEELSIEFTEYKAFGRTFRETMRPTFMGVEYEQIDKNESKKQ